MRSFGSVCICSNIPYLFWNVLTYSRTQRQDGRHFCCLFSNVTFQAFKVLELILVQNKLETLNLKISFTNLCSVCMVATERWTGFNLLMNIIKICMESSISLLFSQHSSRSVNTIILFTRSVLNEDCRLWNRGKM